MSRKRWMWIGALAAVLLGLALLVWSQREQFEYAHLATGYAAKTTCSCRHISGRTMESCIADFPEDARSNIDIVEDGDRVRASVLLGAISAEAQYEDGFGCRILD